MNSELLLIALGGNALIKKGEKGSFEEQYKNVQNVTKLLVQLIEAGNKLVITHGNGPQVGATLLRHDAGNKLFNIPVFPMDACTAETQGFIGYIIQHVLQNEIRSRGINKEVITVITRVIVDKNDPAFRNPTKPVGPFYSKEEIKRLHQEHPDWKIIEDSGRGYRRVVPSPDPKSIVEFKAIKTLIDNDFIVIACGGGGIPVIEEDGKLKGIEAVVDKDLASERLATLIRADRFIILTDVDAAYINYGTPNQYRIENIHVEELKKYYTEGHFKPGSMGPKILASIRFIENGGKEAIIAHLDRLVEAIKGDEGTHILP
ncbi:MAG: carbamate kinase [Thermoprotei archaeon]|jgi:carbamate kinase